jgi:transcriptional regulator with XRE-family HTH domain
VDNDRGLRAHIGSTLRRRRERDGLTQAELAIRVETSQATVARIERGDRAPSMAMLERLFAVLSCQVRLVLEPLDQDIDRAIAALASVPIAKRIAAAGIPAFAEDLSPIPFVFTSATAALLQGAPVPAETMEIALARRDCDAFTIWLKRRYGHRWHPQYQAFGFAPVDPRRPGVNLWRIIRGVVIRIDLVDDLPSCLEVRHGDRTYRVVPLPDIEIQDTDAARLLRRFREQQSEAVPVEAVPGPAQS